MPKRRGSIERRGNDQYRIRIYIGPGADGKPRYHRETIKGTRGQANQRLTAVLKELDDGVYIEPSKVTVAEFLDRWMRDYVATKMPKTQDTYANLLKYVNPRIGHLQLQKLRPYHLQALYRDLAESGRLHPKKDGPKGLSSTSVKDIHRTFNSALEVAVQWGLLVYNPAQRIKPPTAKRKKLTVWTDEELARFLEATSGHRLYALYALVTATGLRRGEVAGLRWTDIGMDACTVGIRQQVITVKGKIVIQAVPKTEASEAEMAVTPAMIQILHRHKLQQQKERWGWKDRYEDHSLVFCQSNGRPLRVDNLRRTFELLCKKAGVPRIRFHDLRHSYATYLFGRGFSVPDVQVRLRHTKASTTVDIYGHSSPDAQRKTAASSDAILPSGNVPKKHAH